MISKKMAEYLKSGTNKQYFKWCKKKIMLRKYTGKTFQIYVPERIPFVMMKNMK